MFAIAGALGGGVADHLTSGGFDDPSSESERADDALAERFDTGVPNVLLLVTAGRRRRRRPAVAAAGTALTAELAAEDGVDDVVSYWSEGNAPPLRNDDGSRALVVARVEGNDDQVEDRVTELAPAMSSGGAPPASTPLPSTSRWAASPRCSTRWATPSRRTCSGPRPSPCRSRWCC